MSKEVKEERKIITEDIGRYSSYFNLPSDISKVTFSDSSLVTPEEIISVLDYAQDDTVKLLYKKTVSSLPDTASMLNPSKIADYTKEVAMLKAFIVFIRAEEWDSGLLSSRVIDRRLSNFPAILRPNAVHITVDNTSLFDYAIATRRSRHSKGESPEDIIGDIVLGAIMDIIVKSLLVGINRMLAKHSMVVGSITGTPDSRNLDKGDYLLMETIGIDEFLYEYGMLRWNIPTWLAKDVADSLNAQTRLSVKRFLSDTLRDITSRYIKRDALMRQITKSYRAELVSCKYGEPEKNHQLLLSAANSSIGIVSRDVVPELFHKPSLDPMDTGIPYVIYVFSKLIARSIAHYVTTGKIGQDNLLGISPEMLEATIDVADLRGEVERDIELFKRKDNSVKLPDGLELGSGFKKRGW